MSEIRLVFDEGAHAGLGHRRRMEALHAAIGTTAPHLDVRLTSTEPLAIEDKEPVVVVVDSYEFDAGDRERFPGSMRVAVDDLERPLAVDLLIDPNPDRVVRDRARRVLAGPSYALVDPSLAQRQPSAGSEGRLTVLVTMGASVTAGALAADVAREVARTTAAEVVFVRGPWAPKSPRFAKVREVAAPDGLAELLDAATVVVTAAGVTMLESLVLGRPTVAVLIADNQRRQARGAAAAGAALVCEPSDAASRAAGLLADPRRRAELAARGPRYVDGRGAARVAVEVASLA